MTAKEVFIVSIAQAFINAPNAELASAQVRGLCYGAGIVNGVSDSGIEAGINTALAVHDIFDAESKVATIEQAAALLFREAFADLGKLN